MSVRDLEREQRFLRDAAHGHQPYVEHATARLDAGQRLYGDSWASIGMRQHLLELAEEAADLGSWSALAMQALDHEPDLSDSDRDRVAAVLQLVARRGAQAHEALSAALQALAANRGTHAADGDHPHTRAAQACTHAPQGTS